MSSEIEGKKLPNGQDPGAPPLCSLSEEFLAHRKEMKEGMTVISNVAVNLALLGEHAKHLPEMAEQNCVIAREIRGLRDDIVTQLGKLIDKQSGIVPLGYIPLKTYEAHIDAYKDTYRFFAKVVAAIVISLFGLAKLGPDIFDKLLGH